MSADVINKIKLWILGIGFGGLGTIVTTMGTIYLNQQSAFQDTVMQKINNIEKSAIDTNGDIKELKKTVDKNQEMNSEIHGRQDDEIEDLKADSKFFYKLFGGGK